MKKLFVLFIFLFSLLVYSAAFGGSATLESNLVVKARPLPPAIGENNAQQLVGFSIASYLNNEFNLDRFTNLCQDPARLRARLRTAVLALDKESFCGGTTNILDSCFSAGSVCDDLLQGGCSFTQDQFTTRCVQRWNNLEQQNNANPAVREAAIRGRCNSIDAASLVDACAAGELVQLNIGLPVNAQGAEEACIRQGYVFDRRGNRAACVSSGGESQDPIFIDSNEVFFPDDELFFPEDEFPDGFPSELTEEELNELFPTEVLSEDELFEFDEAGTENQSTRLPGIPSNCSALLNACPTGYQLRSGVDAVTGCQINQCIVVQTSATTGPSCTDSDSGLNVGAQGTTTEISATGVQLQRVDECMSSTALTEYYCVENSLRSLSVSCTTGCEEGHCKLSTSTAIGSGATSTVSTVTSSRTTSTIRPRTTTSVTTSPTSSAPTTTSSTTTSPSATTGTTSTVSGSISPTSTTSSSTESSTTSTPSTTPTVSTVKTITSPISARLVAPFTVKIIAVPAIVTGLATLDDVAADAFVDPSQCTAQHFRDQCVAQLRAASLGSFNPIYIQSECQTEVRANVQLVNKFCQRPEAAYNECTQHTERVCTVAREANELCLSLVNDNERLIDQLTEIVLNKCESEKLQGTSFGSLSSKLPSSSAFLANGADAKLKEAEIKVEKTTGGKDILYSIQQTICLKYGEEKEDARSCRKALEEFDGAISLMESLKEQLSEEDKQFVDRELEKVRNKRVQLATKCASKDRNAGGICSLVLGN